MVFPIFGPPSTGSMPQHGFARRSVWKVVDTHDAAESAGVTLQLEFPAQVSDGIGEDNAWAEAAATSKQGEDVCTLLLKVDVSGKALTST
jgi:D-hexose-6-phosphate mutarotase